MHSKIVKNYLYNLSYQVLVLLTPLITTPYISRTLGAKGVGIYSYRYSIVAYFSIFAALGMQIYGQLRLAAVREKKEEFSKLFFQILITKLITAALSITAYYSYVLLLVTENKDIALVLGLNIAATFLDISWFLQSIEEFKRTAIRNYIVKICSLILIFCFVKDENDVLIYALILQGSVFVGNISLWIGIKKYLVPVRIESLEVKNHLLQSLAYFVPTLASTLYSYFDKTMIGFFSSTVQNGFYEQAYKLENVSITIVSSLSIVIMPRIAFLYGSKNKGEIDRILKKTSRTMIFLAAPIAAGLFSISNTLIPWFLGEEFLPSIPLLKMFSFILLIDVIKDFYGTQILIPTKHQREYNIATVLGTLVNITFNYLLIRRFYALGACVASVISEVFVIVLFAIICKEMLPFTKIMLSGWKYFFASIIMGIIVHCMGTLRWNHTALIVIQIMVGILSYVSLLLILQDSLVKEIKKQVLTNRRRTKDT